MLAIVFAAAALQQPIKHFARTGGLAGGLPAQPATSRRSAAAARREVARREAAGMRTDPLQNGDSPLQI